MRWTDVVHIPCGCFAYQLLLYNNNSNNNNIIIITTNHCTVILYTPTCFG
jgi:hypothetical protein